MIEIRGVKKVIFIILVKVYDEIAPPIELLLCAYAFIEAGD